MRQAISGQSVNNAWRLGLSSTFEIDFWGRLRRGAESATATAMASRYAAEVVKLTTVGVTAQTYFALRSLDAQIATTQATLGSRTEALRLIERRAEAGLVSDLDVNQAQLARADAAALLHDLVRQRAVAQHALGVLTGNLDLVVPAAGLMRMPVPAAPPPGLPSTLLVRRPDIRQAEQELIAANARIGVARADMFPTISLTAGFGTLSTALTQFVDTENRTWAVGGNLLGPIFDAGRRRALTEAEEARTRQQVANYRRVIERSFREVADALVTVRESTAAETDQETRVRAATNALRLANLRYEAGYSAFLEVLDAQRNANDARLSLIRNRQTLLSAQVDLMRALGGGWSPDQPLLPVTASAGGPAPDAAAPAPAALQEPPGAGPGARGAAAAASAVRRRIPAPLTTVVLAPEPARAGRIAGAARGSAAIRANLSQARPCAALICARSVRIISTRLR